MPQHIPSPVLILRADHYSSLGIMRSLGRLGIPAYVVHAKPDAAPLKSRYCAGSFVWDLDASPELDSVQFLLSLRRKIEDRKAVAALSPTELLKAILTSYGRPMGAGRSDGGSARGIFPYRTVLAGAPGRGGRYDGAGRSPPR